ncbi:MAG: DUF4870 domain-containing protein [Gemmatimonadota bacterium]
MNIPAYGHQPESPEGYGPRGASDDQMWALLAYLLALIAAIIAPLVIYLVKMNESRYVRFHAAQALNLSITGIIYAIALVIIAIPLALVTHGLGLILIVLGFIALGVAHLVYIIMGAVRANQGQLFRIPTFLCFPMVR